LLPSEYFRRQIYGCFWFERDSALHAIEQLGADNILYETDYPHPTSMSPGPASHAQRPDDYLRSGFSGLDEVSMRKILHDNAARIYHLD
jgi:predicted TIM-barrel fold metal-dependent hydrolase